ncbi:hypothetical protein BJV78DRAFT_1229291 [Lactifluus subvellereus]|nr:hypothetical protein BJV78DRAFT_1229291 [Lactifluus subvellereus]
MALQPNSSTAPQATGSVSHASASGRPAPAGNVVRNPPDILTYCYGSKMVYVTPGDSYEHAIDLAQEAFPELRDVDRDQIGLEVRVVVSHQSERRTAQIGRTAWPVVLTTLARFEIVEVHVASPPQANAVAQPPPYASEAGWRTDKKGPRTDPAPPRPQASYSQPHSITSRVVELFCPNFLSLHFFYPCPCQSLPTVVIV